MNNSSRLLWYSALTLAACGFLVVPAMAQMTSTGIDCSQVRELNLLQQENMRAGAALIECGIVQGGSGEAGSDNEAPQPPNVLVSNRSCSSASSCTKSEDMV